MTNVVDLNKYKPENREAELDLAMSGWGAALWAAIHDQKRIPEPQEAKALRRVLDKFVGGDDAA